MTSYTVKNEIEHKINLSLLRHRGDVYVVSKELGIPADYVGKIYKKLKKRRERDVSFWVASGIMQSVVVGYQQRVGYIQKYLEMLENKEQVVVSSCCHKPMTVLIDEGDDLVCSKCNKKSQPIVLPRSETYKLFNDLIEQLREEDKSLVDFADKMGFTDKEEQPSVRQNVLIVGNKTIEVEPEVKTQIGQLSPREREKTRKSLEKHLLRSAEDNNEQ